jgi:hypothetical protein
MPSIYVSATERDADGLVEFCTSGIGTDTDHGSNGNCDIVWSVTSAGIVATGSITDYPTCNDLGFDDADPEQRCLTITTGDEVPGGYPKFTAYVGVTVDA